MLQVVQLVFRHAVGVPGAQLGDALCIHGHAACIQLAGGFEVGQHAGRCSRCIGARARGAGNQVSTALGQVGALGRLVDAQRRVDAAAEGRGLGLARGIGLLVGLGAALLAAAIGIPAGLAAGYFGGWVDAAISYVINLFVAMPGLVLALIITAVIGVSLPNLILVLGMVGWPAMARLMRGQALAIREKTFVEAARVAGAGAPWILWHHVGPNVRRLGWSQLSLTIAQAIFTSSSLSFLGLGVPPPLADWGGMVRIGGDFLATDPWLAIAPSAAVAITILGFYLVGSDR